MLSFIVCLSLFGGASAVENYIAHIGSAALLSCRQFNALNKAEQDSAISWAFGFVSAAQSERVERAREKRHPNPIEVVTIKPEQATQFALKIEEMCRERPNVPFVDVVGWTYAEWGRK
jgi:hypothetical protein